jgi:hypothetical protein
MIMNFQALEQSIIDNVLVPAQAGRYETLGAKRQTESDDAIHALRKVMVYYQEGEFPKGAGTLHGDVVHNCTFNIVLITAAAAGVDLSALNSETVSDSDRAAALRAMRDPSITANRDLNDLIAIVWQVLMDNRNDQMGIDPPADRPNLLAVADRWVDNVQKNDPLADGEYVTITATMRLTCRIEEFTDGEDLVNAGNKTFESDIALDGDTAQQGVTQVTP